ncbi:MAG: DnaB-like helicase C-terminal domain-containing protein [Chlamydiota bacterium]
MNEPLFLKKKSPSKEEAEKLAQLYNHEAEALVLSAMLQDQNHALKLVLDTGLKGEMFYFDFHRALFSAVVNIFLEKKPIAIANIKEWMKAKKMYTSDWLSKNFTIQFAQVYDNFCPTHDILSFVAIVREYDMRRKFFKMCKEGSKGVFDTSRNIFDLTSEFGKDSIDLSDPLIGADSSSLAVSIEKRVEELQKEPKKGILSGIRELDNVLLGFMRGELTILGARPSVGKTSFLVHLYIQSCNQGKKALFFNLEMGNTVFADRILSYIAEVPIYNLRKHKLSAVDWEAIYKSTAPYLKEDCRTVSKGALSINEIVALARKNQARYGLDIIFIDYIQLVTSDDTRYHQQNREQELAKISKALKDLALNLKIHVVCAAQLNRCVENRAGNKPRSSDLRESGAMEQDADNILLLNRLEKYGITQSDEGKPTEGVLDIIVAKQRNGECKTVQALFNARLSKVTENDFF